MYKCGLSCTTNMFYNLWECDKKGCSFLLVAVENHVIDLGVFAVWWSHLTELATTITYKTFLKTPLVTSQDWTKQGVMSDSEERWVILCCCVWLAPERQRTGNSDRALQRPWPRPHSWKLHTEHWLFKQRIINKQTSRRQQLEFIHTTKTEAQPVPAL